MYLQKFAKHNLSNLLRLLLVFVFASFLPITAFAATSWSALTTNSNLSVNTNLSTTADRYWYPLSPSYGFSFNENVTFDSITLKIKNSSTQMNTPHLETFRQFGAGTCSKNEIDGFTEIAANYDGYVTFTFASPCSIPSGSPFYVQMNGESGTSFQLYGTNTNTYGADTRAKYGGSGSSNDATLYHPFLQFNGGTFTPPPTCVDGIQNGDETAVDRGGSCASVVLNTPADTDTVSDFSQWNVTWDKIDTGTDPYVVSVHMSTDNTLLATCEDFPSGSGYSTCITGSPNITADYSPIFSSGITSSTLNISKSAILVTGTTYYVQVVIQDNDPYGAPLFVSDITSFTVGVPTSPDTLVVSCTTFDVVCYIKQAVAWAFTISPETLQQFSTLTLENSAPFSYLYDVGNLFDELFSNSGSMEYAVSVDTGALGTISFISASQIAAVPYASTIKSLIGALLYFFTAMTLYRKLLKVHDSNSHV